MDIEVRHRRSPRRYEVMLNGRVLRTFHWVGLTNVLGEDMGLRSARHMAEALTTSRGAARERILGDATRSGQ